MKKILTAFVTATVFFNSCNNAGEQKYAPNDSTHAMVDTSLIHDSGISSADSASKIPAQPSTTNTEANKEDQQNESSFDNLQVTGVALRNSGNGTVRFYFSYDGTTLQQSYQLEPGEAYDYRIQGNSVMLMIATTGEDGQPATYRAMLDKGKRYHLVFDYGDNMWKVQGTE
jgi:hypothetical protein